MFLKCFEIPFLTKTYTIFSQAGFMYVIAKAHPIYTMYFLFIYSIYKVPTVFILFDNSQTELCILDNCFNLDYRFHAVREREIKSMTTKT